MSDLAKLQIGARPWLPTDASEAVETYDFYDMPTTGLIKQSASYFLFDCLEGHVMSQNVWLYAHVSESEMAALDEASAEDFVHLSEQIFSSRSIMVGVAIDGRIRAGNLLQESETAEQGLIKAVTAALSRGTRASTQATEAIEHLVAC